MAKPIKETPVLKGKDAKRFLEAIRTPKPEPKEVVERAKATFEKFQKMATFAI